MEKAMIGTTEAAKILGISRVAVFKRIKKGQIKAIKVGRNYVIDKQDLGDIYQKITPEAEIKIDATVDRIVKEYGEALKRLGRE